MRTPSAPFDGGPPARKVQLAAQRLHILLQGPLRRGGWHDAAREGGSAGSASRGGLLLLGSVRHAAAKLHDRRRHAHRRAWQEEGQHRGERW